MHDDSIFSSRPAPETDVFEAAVSGGQDIFYQSLQWAFFNAGYEWFNTTGRSIVPDLIITEHNSNTGGVSFLFSKPWVREVALNGLRYLLSVSNQSSLQFP